MLFMDTFCGIEISRSKWNGNAFDNNQCWYFLWKAITQHKHNFHFERIQSLCGCVPDSPFNSTDIDWWQTENETVRSIAGDAAYDDD